MSAHQQVNKRPVKICLKCIACSDKSKAWKRTKACGSKLKAERPTPLKYSPQRIRRPPFPGPPAETPSYIARLSPSGYLPGPPQITDSFRMTPEEWEAGRPNSEKKK